MPLEGRAGAEGIRGSQQHAVEVDIVVTDPMLHGWQEAQKTAGRLQSAQSPEACPHIPKQADLVSLDLPCNSVSNYYIQNLHKIDCNALEESEALLQTHAHKK